MDLPQRHALALYLAGANVTLACRDQDKAEQARAKMKQQSGSGSVKIGVLDLEDLDSVRLFAETYIQQHTLLDLLINNAGVGTPPAAKTSQGYEYTFAVNFLGPFALTGLLYPLLQETPGSRVVTVSSFGYVGGMIDFDNLKSEKGYDAVREYGQNAGGLDVLGRNWTEESALRETRLSRSLHSLEPIPQK